MAKRYSNDTHLTEQAYYILLSLLIPLHGYGIMQAVKRISNGKVVIGAGTVYGALDAMVQSGWVQLVAEEGRRKIYLITDEGKQVLRQNLERVSQMSQAGEMMLPMMESDPIA